MTKTPCPVKVKKTASPLVPLGWQAILAETHPPDILELLGANIVGVHNEGPVILVQETAQLFVILQENT